MPTFDKLMCKTLLKLGYPRFDDVLHTERKAEVVQACCRFSVDENKLGCRGDKRPIGVRAKSPRSDIVMGFGTELQGLNSHESLVQLQDTEIRVLENIRKCLTLRIKCDRDYAAQLSQMVGSAQRLEVAKDYETPVYQTWVAMVKETEVFAHNIKTNADKLHTRTLDKLVQIINEKKSARKIYSDEKARLENEYNKLHSEVERLKLEYEKLVNKVNQDKAKYDEVLTKGKGGSKLESAKQKYIQTESRLQKVHNDYITTLTETGLHHKMYVRTTLPGLLDHQQEVQETLVTQCKDVLQDYSELTNTSRDPFANCHQQISKHINGIHPSGEYDDFLISKRSDALIAKKYGYSTGLLNKYQGTLKEDDVALNHITVENLKHSRSSYEDSLAKCREKMTVKRKRLNELENEVERNVPNDDHDDVVKLSYYKSRRELSLARRELTELGCIEEKFKELQSMVDEPLKSLVGNDVPPGIMFDPSEENKDDTGSMSSQSSKEKKAKPFDSIKSALSQKLNRRHQSGNPPKPPSRDFVDTKVNGEEESAGAASVSSDAEKGSAAMSDGYQQMTVHPNRQLDEEEWFHGVLPRDEVQRLLVNDGDYLVRESVNRKTQETQYVLSVQWQGHKHFIIQGSEETGWRFEGDSYPTIQELIIHQHKSGVPVTKKSEAILSKPVLQEEWELRNDDITLGQKIGNGNFGDVYRGIFKPKDLQVAVKTCRETLSDDAKKKFLQEGRILKQFMHPNIVEFIGIGAQKQPVMIVMEYVPGGALLNFLRKKGQDQTTKTLVGMSVDAAFGMEYLEERNCIHRDLAARNCLVGKENVVKISDFGMSREEEEYTVSGGLKQIPIKWTAPEALNYGRYTSASDVWSFGILMWEIYSFGAVPYPGMTNQQAKEKVDEGYRLPAPEGTPEKAYTVMMKCWEKEDKDRSKFGELHSELKAFHSTL